MTLPALALFLCGCIRPGNDEVLVTPYTKIDFPADGQAREFSISSNFLWTIEISDTWITINPMKGYGDKNMMVTALPNTSLDARQSSFFIVGEQIRREITVTQKGEVPELALDNTQRTVKAAGDTVSVGVTTNVELNVVPEQDWVSYKETKTVTTKRYIFTVQQNTSLEGRSCRIQFTQKNGSLSAVFTILQDGESPAIELETNTITAVAQGGQYKVTVLSNIEWEAATETSWIHLTGTRLMQPQDCVFMVDANPRVETRQGTLVISTPGHPNLGQSVVTVTQEGAEPHAILDPSVLQDIPAAGGTYTIAVQSNFNWKEDLSKTAGWISQVIHLDNGLRITINRNDDVEPRSTILDIVQENGPYVKTISITQLAGERKLYLPGQENIPKAQAAGGTLSIPVLSNVPWKASVSEEWLSVVETKALETKTLSLQVQPNTRTEARQAQLTVTTLDEEPLVVTRTIRQEGAQPYIICDPDTLEVPATGAAYSIPVQANVSWGVLSHPSWVTGLAVEPRGEYGGNLTFTVQPNMQTTARSSKIELARTGGTLRVSLVINQAPEAVFVNASVNAPEILHNEGDSFTLTVESNIATEYMTEAGWLVNTTKIVEGRKTTWNFNVLPATTLSTRSTVLYVREAGTDQVYKAFTLTQRGARIAQRDSTALVRFHRNMRGDNWRDTHVWNLQLPADTWAGVTLESAIRNGARYVKKLVLSNGRLEGSVGDGQEKDPLSVLTYLEEIDLSNNSGVTGWLPISWKDLNNLEIINLENCNLTNFLLLGYNIPAQYATGLKNLTTFIIRNNLLNGMIPREILDHPHFEAWNFKENMQPQKGTNQLSLPGEPSEP